MAYQAGSPMREVVLVVGSGSFLAREFVSSSSGLAIRAVRHDAYLDASIFDNVACVVNFAFHPSFHVTDYGSDRDIDLCWARNAVQRSLHYVMLSSRRVYDKEVQWHARESDPASGLDIYGKNKVIVEKALQVLLGDHLTILRPGNVMGYENITGRARFGAYLLTQLARSNSIQLTLNPRVRRDIVPADFFCEVLRKIIDERPAGIYNVGAGQSSAVGDIARLMIEGYGAGELIAKADMIEDEFELDSSKLKSEFGFECGLERVARYCRQLGRRLAADRPGPNLS